MSRYEYKVIDTAKQLEAQLNELGAEGWQVVGVTTKKQLFIAPPQAIILMREVQAARRNGEAIASRMHASAQPRFARGASGPRETACTCGNSAASSGLAPMAREPARTTLAA